MRVYLTRHGEAVSPLEDAAQPLSSNGRAAVERLARQLAAVAAIAGNTAVRHSGKLRAAQTAEFLCTALAISGKPQVVAGLAPNDPAERALELIAAAETDLMLVGHLPHLAGLASALLTATIARPFVRFAAGAVVCLARDTSGEWTLEWALSLDLVP